MLKSRIFASIEQMLSPEGLSIIVNSTVSHSIISDFSSEGFSTSTLQKLAVVDFNGCVFNFVIKYCGTTEDDWLSRLTKDNIGREASLYCAGILSRLPSHCISPIVALCHDHDRWVILMLDVATDLLPTGDMRVSARVTEICLRALANLHQHFMNDNDLGEPSLGLCNVTDWLMLLSPAAGHSEAQFGRLNSVTGNLVKGWELFSEIASPRAAKLVNDIHSDPAILSRAITNCPKTLLHGDYKFANVAVRLPKASYNSDAQEQFKYYDVIESDVIMLDWQLATYGLPLLDLGYFLAVNSAKLPIEKEAAIEIYRDALSMYGYNYPIDRWAQDLTLGLLAGGLLRLGWAKALGTQSQDPFVRERELAEIEWWSEIVVEAGRWLG